MRHSTLSEKLALLPLVGQVHNWVIDYLTDRCHRTRYNGVVSAAATITASIVQGSGIGPVTFVINNSDLEPLCAGNLLVKYADDTDLLVPACNTPSIPNEMQRIASWSSANNLVLNEAKSCELVVRRPRGGGGFVLPPETPNIVRVHRLTMLGMTFDETLGFERHFDRSAGKAAQSMYALKVLRSHGLEGQSLWDTTQATLLSSLMYGFPAWWGYTNAGNRDRFESIIRRLKRNGFLPTSFATFNDLCTRADNNLFNNILKNPSHVLYPSLFLSKKRVTYFGLEGITEKF